MNIKQYVLENAKKYSVQESILPETIYVEISFLVNDVLNGPYDREKFLSLAKFFKENPPIDSEQECRKILKKRIINKCREVFSTSEFDSIERQINRL